MMIRSRKQSRAEPGPAGKRGGLADALTTADLVVLSLLCEQPMHGYELANEYERQDVKDWARVSRPHIYYALRKLLRLKLIQAIGKVTKASRPRNVVTVSVAGRKALTAALERRDWVTDRSPSLFTTWLGLSIHARPSAVIDLLAVRRKFLKAQIAIERATLASVQDDSARRARVAAIMVSHCLTQFELELSALTAMESLCATQ